MLEEEFNNLEKSIKQFREIHVTTLTYPTFEQNSQQIPSAWVTYFWRSLVILHTPLHYIKFLAIFDPFFAAESVNYIHRDYFGFWRVKFSLLVDQNPASESWPNFSSKISTKLQPQYFISQSHISKICSTSVCQSLARVEIGLGPDKNIGDLCCENISQPREWFTVKTVQNNLDAKIN